MTCPRSPGANPKLGLEPRLCALTSGNTASIVAGPVPNAAGPIYWLAVAVALPDLMIDEVWGAGHAELLGPPLLSWVLSVPQLLGWVPYSLQRKGRKVPGTRQVLRKAL